MRYEYANGYISAMRGASGTHGQLVQRIGTLVDTAMHGRLWHVYGSNLRVGVRASGAYKYPDVSGRCGRPDFEPTRPETCLNASFMIEVLSRSTEANDRGAKFAHDMHIPSLSEYVLVAQDQWRVERVLRNGRSWRLDEYTAPDDVVELPSVGYARRPRPRTPRQTPNVSDAYTGGERTMAARPAAAPTAAPTSVHTTFTPSLSSARVPPTTRVGRPQRACTDCSVASPQTSHQRRSCTVAPTSVSATAPAIPPANAPAAAARPSPTDAGEQRDRAGARDHAERSGRGHRPRCPRGHGSPPAHVPGNPAERRSDLGRPGVGRGGA